MWGVLGLVENIESHVFAALQAATEFWARGKSRDQVFILAEELRAKPGSQFYAQLSTAAAEYFAFRGHEAEGRRELAYYVRGRDLNEKAIDDLWRTLDVALLNERTWRPTNRSWERQKAALFSTHRLAPVPLISNGRHHKIRPQSTPF